MKRRMVRGSGARSKRRFRLSQEQPLNVCGKAGSADAGHRKPGPAGSRAGRGAESRSVVAHGPARRGVARGPLSGRLRRPTVDAPAVRRPGNPSSTKSPVNQRALCLFSRADSEHRRTPAFEIRLPAACPFGCVAAHSHSLVCSPQYISCARERVTVAPARRGRTRIGALRRGDADAAYGEAGERTFRTPSNRLAAAERRRWRRGRRGTRKATVFRQLLGPCRARLAETSGAARGTRQSSSS